MMKQVGNVSCGEPKFKLDSPKRVNLELRIGNSVPSAMVDDN